MTVTIQALQLDTDGWAVNARVTSATGAVIKDAPGAGKFLHIQQLEVSTSATCLVQVEASGDFDSASQTVTSIAGPLYFGSGAFNNKRTLIRPLKLPANEEIRVRSGASALVNIFASGIIS